VLEGVQFVVDEKGRKKAVQLDLETWGELWEDIYDSMIARSRGDEPTKLWEDLKDELGLDEKSRS